MYLADYHVHSRVSPDAGDTMTELAGAALRAGLDEVCFTDHVEPKAVFGADCRWELMRADFQAAQQALGHRLCLRLGVELGDAPWDFDGAEQLLKEAPELDLVIGSIHCLSPERGGMNWYFYRPQTERDARAGMEDYLSQLRRLAQWGRFTVLGHLTVPLRYLRRNGWELSFDAYEDEVREILSILIQKGCGIELNTDLGGAPLPGAKWLKLYRELGGEIVTLGSDTHRAETVGAGLREGQRLLRDCGFTKFCTFEKMDPIWHAL